MRARLAIAGEHGVGTTELDTDDPEGLWVEGEGDARLRVAARDWDAAPS